jgi:outer membrane biosynthesis protein TonB
MTRQPPGLNRRRAVAFLDVQSFDAVEKFARETRCSRSEALALLVSEGLRGIEGRSPEPPPARASKPPAPPPPSEPPPEPPEPAPDPPTPERPEAAEEIPPEPRKRTPTPSEPRLSPWERLAQNAEQ